MPRLTAGPFRYLRYADGYLDVARRYARVPVKQAVVSPSALSLMYPAADTPGSPRERFVDDLLREHEAEVRACLRKGAHAVQVDFTEGRLTGWGQEGDRERSREAGCDGHLVKPVNLPDLDGLLRELADPGSRSSGLHT